MDAILSRAWEYGFALVGAVATIGVLGAVVRILWQQARAEQVQHVKALSEQFSQRLTDKNSELSQVWTQLREARDEVKIVRAEKEWLERMNDRGDDMVKTLIEAWLTRIPRR